MLQFCELIQLPSKKVLENPRVWVIIMKSSAGWGPRAESPGIQQFAWGPAWRMVDEKRKDRCRRGDHKSAPGQLHLLASHASLWLWLNLSLVSQSRQFFCWANSPLWQGSLSHSERQCRLRSQGSLGHRLVPWRAFCLSLGTDFLKPPQFCQAFSCACYLYRGWPVAPILRTWWKQGGKPLITISGALSFSSCSFLSKGIGYHL